MKMKNLGFMGFENYAVTEDGRVYSLWSKRFLKPAIDRYGYYKLTLRADNKNYYRTIHRLVALAFIDGNAEGLQVNHKDGNKLNNNVSNLEWMTVQDNVTHAMETGLWDANRTYNDDKVRHVCSLLESGMRNKDIADITGATPKFVSEVRRGTVHSDISKEYNISFKPAKKRISIDKIFKICELLQEGQLIPSDIARTVGVSLHTVRYIKRRETYTDISKNYHW